MTLPRQGFVGQARLRIAYSGRALLRSTRSSVLVIVLVTLVFTAVALVAFIEQASNDLLVEARAAAARRLRREAYSALEVTLATLEDFRRANGALHHPAEGWDDPLGFAGWTPREGCTAEVTFVDESGKFPLARADTAMLVNLFKEWEFAQADAEHLADALLGWMHRDHVPATGVSPDYDRGDLPFNPPGRPLRSYSELAAIDYARDVFYDAQGRPNERWRRFAATFSLFDYGQLNLNAAPPDVLVALGFTDPAQQQRMADYLAGSGANASLGPRWFSSPGDATSVLGSAALPAEAGAQVRALRVNITLREGRSEFRLTAVVSPVGGASLVPASTPVVSSTALDNTAPAAAAPPARPALQLNYPFTLLEIRENAEMSPVPSAPPAA